MAKLKEEIKGSFELGHLPRRIRSLRKKPVGKNTYSTDMGYPYDLV
jgi:hypothetical protein